jgi:hypothetical protein
MLLELVGSGLFAGSSAGVVGVVRGVPKVVVLFPPLDVVAVVLVVALATAAAETTLRDLSFSCVAAPADVWEEGGAGAVEGRGEGLRLVIVMARLTKPSLEPTRPEPFLYICRDQVQDQQKPYYSTGPLQARIRCVRACVRVYCLQRGGDVRC